MGRLKALVGGEWVEASSATPLDLAYISGDTMAGALLLPSGDPPSDNAAARKKYVDDVNRAFSFESSATSWDSITAPGVWPNVVQGIGSANGPGVNIYYYVVNYVYGGSVNEDMSGAHTRNLTQVAIPRSESSIYATCQRSRASGVWTAWSSPYGFVSDAVVPASGWAIQNAAYPLTVERNGNAVTMRGLIKPTVDTAITSNHTIATLPSSIYYPPANLLTQTLTYTGTAYRPIDRTYIYSSGVVTINSGHVGAFTMTTAGWFSLHHTWMVD